jgi:regulator of protease activity HflC (stomatin/prohibitin superfamily)
MKKVALISMSIILMISMSSCFRHVPPRNVGIKVKTMGDNKGVQPITLPVGRYWVGAFWQLHLYPTNIHIYPFTAGKDEGSETNEEMRFQDKDGLPLGVDVAVSARVDPALVSVAFQTYNGEMETIIKTYVKQDLLNSFIAYASTRKAENLYSDLKMDMLSYVTKTVADRYAPTGIVITDIAYKSDIRLPQNVMDAINQKIGATQIALKKEQEVMQAEADAKSAVANADGQAKSILIVAQAQAKANQLLSQSVTQILVNYELAKRWNGTSPLYSGNGSVLPPFFSNK